MYLFTACVDDPLGFFSAEEFYWPPPNCQFFVQMMGGLQSCHTIVTEVTRYTGMTWSGFRPSDDACAYGFHIPANLFAASALSYVRDIFPSLRSRAMRLRSEILQGVRKHGTWRDAAGVTRYCYEVARPSSRTPYCAALHS